VTNCYAELSQPHGQHVNTCEFHVQASAVLQAGRLMRYCHLCSSLHLLEEFDGDSRCKPNSDPALNLIINLTLISSLVKT